jgi:hypothetical protein
MNKEENLPAGEDRVPDEEPPQEQPVSEVAKAMGERDEDISSAEPVAEVEQLQTINSKLQTEEMEVHHHTHPGHHKKKWTHYFWEFLMLFLAVSLGFYAENLREGILHKNEVKTHISSLITDLQTDIALFDSVADRNTYSTQMADSLIELLHSDITNTSALYFTARSVTANNGYGYSNSKSFDQLKSSGLLRYIKPKKLLDSIGSYYASFQWLNNQTELMRLKLNEIHKGNALLFDGYVFHQMMNVQLTSFGGRRLIISHPSVKPSLLSMDIKDINTVSLNYHYYSTTTKFYKRTLLDLKDRANRLIQLIKKEYVID